MRIQHICDPHGSSLNACRTKHLHGPTRTALCAALLLALCATGANADDWVNPGTGDWFLASNWADGTVPTAADDVTLATGGTALVRLPGATAASVNVDTVSFGFVDTTLAISDGGSLTTTSGEIAGHRLGAVVIDGVGSNWSQKNDLLIGEYGRGSLSVQDGGLFSVDGGHGSINLTRDETFTSGALNIGNGGAPGFLGVASVRSGAGFAIINFNHNDPEYFFTQNGDEDGLTIPVFGRVAINHKGSGKTVLSGVYNLNIFPGSQAGAPSTVDGGTLVITGVMATDQPFYVGNIGEGVLRIDNGGMLESEGAVIGLNVGGIGSVFVDGPSSIWNTSGITAGSFGRGYLSIQNGGSVRSRFGIVAGRGERGDVIVDGVGSRWDNDGQLAIGFIGQGNLSVINGGSVTSSEGRISEGFSGVGVVTVNGVGSTWTNDGLLMVGGHGDGSVIVNNGGRVTTKGSTIEIARDDGSFGSISVDGVGSSFISSDGVFVGFYGVGAINISNGGLMENSFSSLGFGNGNGTVSVTGAGSKWYIGNLLIIGQKGPGGLVIGSGGIVSDDAARVVCCGVTVEGAGTTWINRSSLLVGRLRDGGLLTVRDGGVVEVRNGDGVLTMGAVGGRGVLNIGSGGDPGILRASQIFGLNENGTATLNFNHDHVDYHFTRDTLASGTPVLIVGTSKVNQIGPGTTILTGAHTYTGATTVNAGTLRVNGSITSTSSVNNVGTLGGSGTVAEVNVADGGILAPGSLVGTLTTGKLLLAGGSRLNFQLASPSAGANDKLVVNGDLVLDGVLNVEALQGFAAGTYRLISFTGGLTDNTLTLGSLPAGFQARVDTSSPGQVNLVIIAGDQTTNHPPTGVVTITGTPREGMSVSAASTLADADGLGTFAYQWFLDDTAVAGATAATLVLDDLAVGKMVRVMVSYTDGQGFAEQVSSPAVGPVAPAGTDLPFQKRLFFVNPADNVNQQTFIRLVNPNDADVAVQILGFDDSGAPAPGGEVVLMLMAQQALQLNAADLERGNTGKGMDGALGNGVGKWQLKVHSTAPIEAMSLIRTPDGFLTSVSETVPTEAPGTHVLYFANPGSNPNQQSFIRVVNRGTASGEVLASAVDDAGVPAPGGDVRFSLAANAALNFNAEDYSNGNPDKGIQGAFGTGTGKWRLTVTSALNLEVMSLIRTPDGFVTDLSNIAPRAAADDDSDRLLLAVSPGDSVAQQGLIRLVNSSGLAEHVILSAVDDSGTSAPGQVAVDVAPFGAVQLLSSDLEQGNPDKGLTGAFGSGQGRWQINMTPSARVETQSLLRVPGGFLTNLSASAPRESRFEARLWIFNPGSNDQQRSILRLINRSDAAGAALIEAIDDAGQPAPGGSVFVDLAPRAAVELDALELETGSAASGFMGALGDGTGKWRLGISADVDIEVQGLLETPTGFLTNLSGTVH